MNNILQAVSYDALFLLRRYGDENTDDFKQTVDKSLIIKIRAISNKLSKNNINKSDDNVSDNVAVTTHPKSSDISKPFKAFFDSPQTAQTKIDETISNLESSEWFVYFLHESSILARKVLKYYFDDALDGLKHSKNLKAKNNKLEYIKSAGFLNGYLVWYSDILDSILNENFIFSEKKVKYDDGNSNKYLATLANYKVDFNRFERNIHLDRMLADSEHELNILKSEVKSEVKQFVDHTLISVGNKVSENVKASEDMVSKVIALHEGYSEVQRKQADYFADIELVNDYCNKRKENIDSIFIAANRQGMANSFLMMANGLRMPMVIWAIVFICSLLLMAGSGFYLNSGFHNEHQAQIVDVPKGNVVLDLEKTNPKNINVQKAEPEVADGDNIISIVIKVLVISPLVWLAWFSGRQFGHASKLRQDYSYKSAVAMAYQGYKEEANGANTDMHGKLLENIVLHFAENPVRLYEKCDSASPFEEVLNKISKEKLSEIIKAIKS